MSFGTEATVYGDLEEMPAEARALFGVALEDSLAWYRATFAAALPAGARPVLLVVGAPPYMVFPLIGGAGGAGSLTSPYSSLWGSLGDAAAPALEQAGVALGRWCRRFAIVRLDALDLGDPRWAPILRGARRAGMVPQAFDHFGNWRADLAGLGWEAYLAARPGALRNTLGRRGSHLRAAGATLQVVDGQTELPFAIAAYEAVYARSWKPVEIFREFIPALMRETAADGSLRLGLLRQGDTFLAAQFWVVRAGTASVLKLAHDEAHKAASPGTVLTGLMIRHLIEQDQVTALDFGRGDDPYKRHWTDQRRQRSGVLLANPRRLMGLAEVACRFAKVLKGRLPRQGMPVPGQLGFPSGS